MNENRVRAGVPGGGRFAASAHGEAIVALDPAVEVEFARDEADQVVLALSNHETILLRDQRSADSQEVLAANREAQRQMTALRAFLDAERPFATSQFSPSQVTAIGDALEAHRERIAHAASTTGSREDRTALNATDAALFRVDIAQADPDAQPIDPWAPPAIE